MIDLFDLKKGEAKYYDKPQKFYVVRNNTNVPRITIKETYAVWRRKTQNKVWFQSKYNKGTRSFDFSYTIDQLANSIPDDNEKFEKNKPHYSTHVEFPKLNEIRNSI